MRFSPRTFLAFGCLALGSAGGFFLSTQVRPIQAQGPVLNITAIPRELTSYRDIVKNVVPAVVSIESKAKPRKPVVRPKTVPQGLTEEQLRQFFGDQLRNDLVQAPGNGGGQDLGFGSGLIIDPNGVVLTNYHVVEGADSVEVKLPDGRKFVSRDIRGDRKTDLAIIRVQTEQKLPYLQFGDSDAMEVGDRVLAVGAPFGLTGSVTHGIVSAKSRNLRLNQYEDFLQTDAAINPGNSGGPLISLEGKVIGINSAIKSRSGGFQGVGLAISSKLAKAIVDQLLKDGIVKRGYLGVQIRDIDSDIAPKLGIREGAGILVTRVFEDAPGAKGGLKAGDILVTIGGKPVREGGELQKVVASLPVNQAVDVSLIRDGKAMQLKLTIEEQPEEFGLSLPKDPD